MPDATNLYIINQNFNNNDATGWSGGSISSSQYRYSATASGTYTVTRTIQAGYNFDYIRITGWAEIKWTGASSDGGSYIKYVNSSGTYTLMDGYQQWFSNNFDYIIPYDPAGMTIQFVINTFYSTSRWIYIDNFQVAPATAPKLLYEFDFASSDQASWWTGGAISSEAYIASGTSGLTLTCTGIKSQGSALMVYAKISYNYSASAARTVSVKIDVAGSEYTVLSTTGTSGSFSGWYAFHMNPTATGSVSIKSTVSNSLTSSYLTIDDVVIATNNYGYMIELRDEFTNEFSYNSSLSYTMTAYYSDTTTDYTITANRTIFSGAIPNEAMLWVQQGTTGYFRKAVGLSQDNVIYTCPFESVRTVSILLVDYTGKWGTLQNTEIIVYNYNRDKVITTNYVDVGSQAIVCLKDYAQYYIALRSDYGYYLYGIFSATSDSLQVVITFAPEGLDIQVNATRLSNTSIEITYNDPQNLTAWVHISVYDAFKTLKFEDNTTSIPASWELTECPNTVWYNIYVSAYVQTSPGIYENKNWTLNVGIQPKPLTEQQQSGNWTLAPPFDMSLNIVGFPVMGSLIAFIMLFITMLFPAPYLRYSLLAAGGLLLFFGIAGWITTVSDLGIMAIGVITIIYAIFKRGA